MIERRVFIVGALSTGFLSGCTTTGLLSLAPSAKGAEIVTAKALPKVNSLRAAEGKPALAADGVLGRVALSHAEYMARNGQMSHDGFERRIRRAKVSLPAAENVAEGQEDIDAMFEAFSNSLHHRENMLGDFARIGVAVAHAGDSRAFWAMDFSA